MFAIPEAMLVPALLISLNNAFVLVSDPLPPEGGAWTAGGGGTTGGGGPGGGAGAALPPAPATGPWKEGMLRFHSVHWFWTNEWMNEWMTEWMNEW